MQSGDPEPPLQGDVLHLLPFRERRFEHREESIKGIKNKRSRPRLPQLAGGAKTLGHLTEFRDQLLRFGKLRHVENFQALKRGQGKPLGQGPPKSSQRRLPTKPIAVAGATIAVPDQEH